MQYKYIIKASKYTGKKKKVPCPLTANVQWNAGHTF